MDADLKLQGTGDFNRPLIVGVGVIAVVRKAGKHGYHLELSIGGEAVKRVQSARLGARRRRNRPGRTMLEDDGTG